MKKEKKNEIPFSNYVKLALLVIFTIGASLVLRNIYISNENYHKNIPIIMDVLKTEINTDEVYNYIRENEDVVLYIGVADNDNCRDLENDLKSLITKKNLEYRITYLNMTKEKNKNSFIKDFNKFYDTKLLGYPSMVVFEEGKVKDIITVKKGDSLSVDKVKEFLKRNNITSNDYD